MSAAGAQEIIEAAKKLDPVERARVADAIWHTLSPTEIEAIEDAEDLAEARAALDEMKRTGAKPIPLEEIKKDFGIE